MNIARAFLWTLAPATAFMVVSLVYLSRDKDRVTSAARLVKSASIGHELLPPHQLATSERRGSGYHGDKTGGATPPEGALQNGSSCEERRSVLLLKTHKTGSSTLQNVLYRYGDARGLTFALPAVDVYMGCPQKFQPAFALRSPTGKFDILANHARFHKENMKKVMAAGAKFITILRYPPKQFESMYSFYRMERRFKCPVEQFAESPRVIYEKHTERNPRHSALNPMLYDLGLDSSAMFDNAQIDDWIQHVVDSFDLVLIAEHLKESLVLLKDLMCWTLEDVTYLTSNARSGTLVKSLSARTESNLLDWLSGDVRLYRHFNATLWQRVQEYGTERMAAEVAELTRRNEALKERCVQGKRPVKEMGGRTVVQRYVLRPEAADDMQCKRITYSAMDYLAILKSKMKLKRPGRKGDGPKDTKPKRA